MMSDSLLGFGNTVFGLHIIYLEALSVELFMFTCKDFNPYLQSIISQYHKT